MVEGKKMARELSFQTPLNNTSFGLPNDVDVLVAMGQADNENVPGPSGLTTPVFSSPALPVSWPSNPRPVFSKKSSGQQTFNIKIVQAFVSGKIDLTKQEQMYIKYHFRKQMLMFLMFQM